MLSLTVIICILTVLLSFSAFNNHKLINDLIFWPAELTRRNQWYRFITYGFIHGDFMHLIFNMIALYSFGESIENYFKDPVLFGENGGLVFLGFYFSALIISVIPDYFQHRDHYHYRALGASGAVSAIIFSAILFNPMGGIGFAFLPGINIPGFIFAVLYLVVSTILAKKGQDNIGHMAHITGSVYGLLFTYLATKLFTDYDVIDVFLRRIQSGF
ncbi:MAG: rhomboid family intramembrane serine protease [Bacteroidetes bacterium]|nr:MAG: rhomboid family intramembrane serine protease [Bacteroidota bacterium]